MGLQSDVGESSCEDAISESETLAKKSTATYKCNYEGCSASFKKPSRLKQHMCKHTGERPFKCDRPNCSRAYTHACHLKRHIAVNHQESPFKRKIKCTYPGCELYLSNESNLKRHYRRTHEKTFVCQECDKRFTKNHHLRAHMMTHAGSFSVRCPECNVGFATGGMLFKKHLRIHKKHTCNVKDCTEEFQKWTDLRRHLKVAHPREYICDICSKKFKSRGNIAQHIRTHLPERPLFHCPFPDCTRSYVRDTYLENHIRWFHEGKGVKCTFEGCGRMICTKARWTKHMAWHKKDHTLPKKCPTGESRKPRHDKGIPRRSMAATLAGIPPLPLHLEKKIILGVNLDSDEDRIIEDLGKLEPIVLISEPSTSSAETEGNSRSVQQEHCAVK